MFVHFLKWNIRVEPSRRVGTPIRSNLLCIGFFIFFMDTVFFSDPIFLWILWVLFIFIVFKKFLYKIWFLYFNFIARMEYVETSDMAIKDIEKIIGRYFPWKSVFYDLGSGRWSLLFPLSKLVPKCRFVGVENIPFQIKFCRFLQKFLFQRKNLHFIQDDFSITNISWANMLFLFVPRWLLPNLKKVLQAKMKKKQILILYRISFLDWKPIEIIPTDFLRGVSQNNIYIYQNT